MLHETCSGHLHDPVFAAGNQLPALAPADAHSCLDFSRTLGVYLRVHILYFFTFPPHIFPSSPCIFFLRFPAYFFLAPLHIFHSPPAYFFIAPLHIFSLPLSIFYKRWFPYAKVKKYGPKPRLNTILKEKCDFFRVFVYIFCLPGNRKNGLMAAC